MDPVDLFFFRVLALAALAMAFFWFRDLLRAVQHIAEAVEGINDTLDMLVPIEVDDDGA